MALHYLLYDTATGLTQRGEVEGTGGSSNPLKTDETTLTGGSSEDFTHNFDMLLNDIQVIIYENGFKLSEEVQNERYVISQVDSNTIRITNSDTLTHTFYAYIWGFNWSQILGRYSNNTTSTTSGWTGLLTVPLRINKSASMKFLVTARKDGSTANTWEVAVQAENLSATTTVTELSRTYFEDVPELDVRVVGNGNEVELQVAGQAGVDIDWFAIAETTHF